MNTMKLLLAMIMVESGGNNYAYNEAEEARGCLQIRPIYVEDINRIYPGANFTLEDCYDRYYSILMVRMYWAHYATDERLGRKPTLEDLARCHNGGGGNGWKNPATLKYWQKVEKELMKMEAERED
jgi:hypothetical protein